MVLPFASLTLARLPRAGKGGYLYKRSATHHHQGIDLAAKRGEPVRAVTAGVVQHASSVWKQGFSGYGRHVVVYHPDLQLPGIPETAFTLYAHLDSVDVRPGQRVDTGQLLGGAGNSQFTKEDRELERGGVHLHFEASPAKYPQPSEAPRLDPVAFLAALEGDRAAARPFVLPVGSDSQSRSAASLSCPHCGGLLVLARGGD